MSQETTDLVIRLAEHLGYVIFLTGVFGWVAFCLFGFAWLCLFLPRHFSNVIAKRILDCFELDAVQRELHRVRAMGVIKYSKRTKEGGGND